MADAFRVRPEDFELDRQATAIVWLGQWKRVWMTLFGVLGWHLFVAFGYAQRAYWDWGEYFWVASMTAFATIVVIGGLSLLVVLVTEGTEWTGDPSRTKRILGWFSVVVGGVGLLAFCSAGLW